MGLIRTLMQTKAHREVLLIRLVVAADLLLDGARAVRWHWLIGDSRLDVLTRLPGSLITLMGYVEIACAALLTVGYLTRPAALLPVALPIMMALTCWARLRSLDAASRLDGVVHCGGIAVASVFLIIKGAGPISLDAMLTGARRHLSRRR